MSRIIVLFTYLLLSSYFSIAQVANTLYKAAEALQKDSQMPHAILALYVVNSNTGDIVCNIHGEYGMAAASSQKIVTAATAFDLLGEHFTYKTTIGYDGNIVNSKLAGNLYIVGQGDPTLGSWRFQNTKRDIILKRIVTFLKNNNIKSIEGNVILDGSKFSYQSTPDGWTWTNLGNYFGAGCWGINWHENQYDLHLQAGNHEGDAVSIIKTEPNIHKLIVPLVKTGPRNSGDKSTIYFSPNANYGTIEGTIPAGEKAFIVSGSLPNPYYQLAEDLLQSFSDNNINLEGTITSSSALIEANQVVPTYNSILGEIQSPNLDSMIYWFFQKSINLYGEALAKTLAVYKNKEGNTENGVSVIQDYWKTKGIDKSSLKMIDGSGLSPQNRVTAKALVQVLQYSKKQAWYSDFYNAIPTFNNMKMKSGTINNTKAFVGYHTSTSGTPYTFAFIINNYDGSMYTLTDKMYKVLDGLK